MKFDINDIDEITEILAGYAAGDFSREIEISEEGNAKDGILFSIKMLGEELENSTVSKDYFKSIYDAISDLIIVTNTDGKIRDVNSAFLSLLGVNKESMINEDVRDFLRSEQAKIVIGNVIEGKEEKGKFESSAIFNGTQMHFINAVSKIQYNYMNEAGILIISKDVTQEKTKENEIINAIIDTEEKERTRMAYDVHDALGQELNSVKMMFDSLLVMDKNTDQFQEVMLLCSRVINDCINSARSLSHDLMPKALEDEKLFNALYDLEYKNRGILEINILVPGAEYTLSKESKINIYRIVQEFLSNTMKHSKAQEVEIVSFIKDNSYHFVISDNGKGFNPNKSFHGQGIKNIKTRLTAIDAEYNLTSDPESGTKLSFTISK